MASGVSCLCRYANASVLDAQRTLARWHRILMHGCLEPPPARVRAAALG